jgi:hypothetical protein
VTDLPRDELEAAAEARRELGPELEPQVIDGFLEKVEKAIDKRVEQRLGERVKGGDAQRMGQRFVVALTSLGTGIPITAIAADEGLAGVAIAWVGIVGVNYMFGRD